MFRYCGSIDKIINKFLYSEKYIEEMGKAKDPIDMEMENENLESDQKKDTFCAI